MTDMLPNNKPNVFGIFALSTITNVKRFGNLSKTKTKKQKIEEKFKFESVGQ